MPPTRSPSTRSCAASSASSASPRSSSARSTRCRRLPCARSSRCTRPIARRGPCRASSCRRSRTAWRADSRPDPTPARPGWAPCHTLRVSYVLAFVGFAALVILHEAGHFAAAKAVGMRVERFALFFPPLIFRWRKKGSETEYAIGAIPLGGYVKITGMSPDEEMPPEVAHRAYFRQKVWKRIVVITAGPAVNVVLAFLILWALYALSARFFTLPVVDKVTAGSPAAEVLRPGD